MSERVWWELSPRDPHVGNGDPYGSVRRLFDNGMSMQALRLLFPTGEANVVTEALARGDDLNDGIDMAQDALVTAFDFYFEDNRRIPPPSAFELGEMAIAVPVEMTERVFQHNAKL